MKEKEIGLSELKEEKKKMKVVDTSKLKVSEPSPEASRNPIMDDAIAGMVNVVDRVKSTCDEIQTIKEEYETEQKMDQLVDEGVEDDADDLVSEFNNSPQPSPRIVVKEDSSDTEKQIDEIDEDDVDLDGTKEGLSKLEKLKDEIKTKIKPVTSKIDLNAFKISKRPVTLNNALKVSNSRCKVADHALFLTGMPTSMKEFSADEILSLSPKNSSRNRFNTMSDIFNLIYSHIVSNKPATMEEWAKLVNFHDYDHLYFNVYKASFNGSNYIPYDCPHCKEVFLSDNIEMDDMIKYKNDDIKQQAQDLYQASSFAKPNEYEVRLEQVSDMYIIGFKRPSLYNVLFETAVLKDTVIEKYKNVIEIISYIDTIYIIDYETQELRPIDVPVDVNNFIKTIKNKMVRYGEILSTLSADEYGYVETVITDLDSISDEITYVMPSIECPKCKKKIPETQINPEEMLFTRHQLTRIANSPTK